MSFSESQSIQQQAKPAESRSLSTTGQADTKRVGGGEWSEKYMVSENHLADLPPL
jgi:hypothetical protein